MLFSEWSKQYIKSSLENLLSKKITRNQWMLKFVIRILKAIFQSHPGLFQVTQNAEVNWIRWSHNNVFVTFAVSRYVNWFLVHFFAYKSYININLIRCLNNQSHILDYVISCCKFWCNFFCLTDCHCYRHSFHVFKFINY